MKHIILDTNFLMLPGQMKVDIFSELERICPFRYTLFVLDKTLEEIATIQKKGSGKDKRNANLALQLLKHKQVKIIPTTSKDYVDDLLVAQEGIIATQDQGLKRRLKALGKSYITLHHKNYLVLKGEN